MYVETNFFVASFYKQGHGYQVFVESQQWKQHIIAISLSYRSSCKVPLTEPPWCNISFKCKPFGLRFNFGSMWMEKHMFEKINSSNKYQLFRDISLCRYVHEILA